MITLKKGIEIRLQPYNWIVNSILNPIAAERDIVFEDIELVKDMGQYVYRYFPPYPLYNNVEIYSISWTI